IGTRLNSSHANKSYAVFCLKKKTEFRKKNAWRFGSQAGDETIREHNGYYKFSIVRSIQLNGPKREVAKIERPRRNVIVWPGFGRITLGEVLVSDNQRRMTMVRLD